MGSSIPLLPMKASQLCNTQRTFLDGPVLQTRELLLRDFRQYNRLLNYVGTRMGITLIIAVFFGTVLAGQVRLPSGRVPQGRRAVGTSCEQGCSTQAGCLTYLGQCCASLLQGDNAYTYNG